jgi:hypothetical protein
MAAGPLNGNPPANIKTRKCLGAFLWGVGNGRQREEVMEAARHPIECGPIFYPRSASGARRGSPAIRAAGLDPWRSISQRL